MDRITCTLLFVLSLVPAAASGQPPQPPMPASPAKAPMRGQPPALYQSRPATPQPIARFAGLQQETPPAPPAPAGSIAKQESTESYSPGSAIPNQGSAWIHPTPPTPTVSAPRAYPATHSETAVRVEDLIRRAGLLVAQGNLSKAMELYDEALSLAPQYPETYRQRALTLLRLGDRVQAQADYASFLALDPQARTRVQQEIQLFGDSGYAQVEDTVVTPSAVSPGAVGGPPYVPVVVASKPYRPAELSAMEYSMARDALVRGNYHTAYQWAQRADQIMPQARIHAIMAQALFAQGAYRGAAAAAREAATMGPLIDWPTLYGYYDYQRSRYNRQFHALEEYVRQNPSSADGRFLLGYEYLILGQTEPAHAQLAIAAVLDPLDMVPRSMLTREGVEIVRGEHPLTTSMPQPGGAGVATRIVTTGLSRKASLSAAANAVEVQR